MASVTLWNRLEPRPRSNDLSESLAAPIRDPLWFLTRQWQLGEFQGRDAGSLAYVDYFGAQTNLSAFTVRGQTADIQPSMPLERQVLAEPFEPDLALRVELWQEFDELLRSALPDAAAHTRLRTALMAVTQFRLPEVDDDALAPLDEASKRFLALCRGRSLDGYTLYVLAQEQANQPAALPAGIATSESDSAALESALSGLVEHVTTVFGALGTGDAEAWSSRRLEYQLEVKVGDPSGQAEATLSAEPNAHGEFDWYAFDVRALDGGVAPAPATPIQFTMIPSSARFPGMPNPRFWYFEERSLSYVDVEPTPTDVVKLLVTDIMLVHGTDWFLLPLDQALGSAVHTRGLVVTDVFGQRSLVSAATQSAQPASVSRWAMFGPTDESSPVSSVASYFIVPPSAGPLAQDGPTLEEVRFARDETANMSWAIERLATTPIGEPRSGHERAAEIAARAAQASPPADASGAALRYQLETSVPANWTPLVATQIDPSQPSIELEKAAIFHPAAGGLTTAFALGRVLNPSDVPTPAPVRFAEEEVPREGLKITRSVVRSRWRDGSTHLWISRRRAVGAGEAHSGLRFDAAQPKER